MRKIPVARRFAVWGDELLGYDRPKPERKWWFDLEEVEGRLVIPKVAGRRGDNRPGAAD
jgi:hypothetical protein